MKDFYGSVSFTGRISFQIKGQNEEECKDVVFEDIEGIDIKLKDGSTLDISEIEWDLIDECRRGNVMQSFVDDFEIYEE